MSARMAVSSDAASAAYFLAFTCTWSPWMKSGPAKPSRSAAAVITATYSAGRWSVYPISLRAIAKTRAPTSAGRAAGNTARPEAYGSRRTLIAGVVKGPTSPRPRARYSSWIDAGRTPACCPISQMSQRAWSRSSGVPNTACRTRWSISALWRTAGLRQRRRVASMSLDMNGPSLGRNLGRAPLNDQAVVRGRDPRRQARRELRVRHLVREMREEGTSRAQLERDGDGLGNREVQRMRPREQRVQHQHLEPRERGAHAFGNRLRVGEVGKRSHAVPEHRTVPVRQRQRAHRYPGDLRFPVRREWMRHELGLARTGLDTHRGIEDVGKPRRELAERRGWAVRGDRGAVLHGDRAQIVDAVHVIGVGVREQHRVDPGDTRRHELQAQLGRGVDEQPPAPGLDHRGGAGALVPRVRRGAGAAGASGLRHAGGRAGAEERQSHVTL